MPDPAMQSQHVDPSTAHPTPRHHAERDGAEGLGSLSTQGEAKLPIYYERRKAQRTALIFMSEDNSPGRRVYLRDHFGMKVGDETKLLREVIIVDERRIKDRRNPVLKPVPVFVYMNGTFHKAYGRSDRTRSKPYALYPDSRRRNYQKVNNAT